MQNCIICGTPGTSRTATLQAARYDCPRCGSFILASDAELALESAIAQVPLRASLMSHALRRTPTTGTMHPIKQGELSAFWSAARLPTPLEQADRLILFIGDNQPTPDDWVEITPLALSALLGIAITSDKGWAWLNGQLKPKELYNLKESQNGKIRLRLSMEGWKKHGALKKERNESRTAFMAMKFGEPELDRAVAEYFKPAVKRAGFELRILTDQQPAGLIDDQLRAALLSTRFVVADLTHGSSGAYWEAGFAEGRGIPVIYTCERTAWNEKKTHFDTNHMATIIWDESELVRAADSLTAMIRATLRTEAKLTDD